MTGVILRLSGSGDAVVMTIALAAPYLVAGFGMLCAAGIAFALFRWVDSLDR